MYLNESNAITVAPAVNGGFVITCRETVKIKEKKANSTNECISISEPSKEVLFVAKDVNSAIKIIKSKLEKYSEAEEDMDEHKGTIKNAY